VVSSAKRAEDPELLPSPNIGARLPHDFSRLPIHAPTLSVGSASDPREHEADRASAEVMQHESARDRPVQLEGAYERAFGASLRQLSKCPEMAGRRFAIRRQSPASASVQLLCTLALESRKRTSVFKFDPRIQQVPPNGFRVMGVPSPAHNEADLEVMDQTRLGAEERWGDALKRMISQADAVVGLVGDDEISPWASAELEAAVAADKPAFALLLPQASTIGMPSVVRTVQVGVSRFDPSQIAELLCSQTRE
jgi:hypothetical protein